MSSESQLQAVVALFEENGRVAAAFWDWRHRLMTFFFTGMAAALAASAWLVTHHAARGYVAIPLASAAGLAVISCLLDRRVGDILKTVHRSGSRYEVALRRLAHLGHVGTYEQFSTARDTDDRSTMSYVLPRMYGVAAIIVGALGIIELLHPLRAS